MSDVWQWPAKEIAKRVRDREISAVAVTQAALDRLAAVNPRINAVVAEFPDQALRLNVSLYMADIDDFQVGTFTGDSFNLTNAATVETWGGEIELFWQATDNLLITGGYSKAVADFDDFPDGNCWNVPPFRFGQADPPGERRSFVAALARRQSPRVDLELVRAGMGQLAGAFFRLRMMALT